MAGTTLEVTKLEGGSRTFRRHQRVPEVVVGGQIVVDKEPRAAGGFGAVHRVVSIDGAPPTRPVLAKVYFTDPLAGLGGRARLLDNYRALVIALEKLQESDWCDAVRALPFTMCQCRHGRRSVLVALMVDLAADGYTTWTFDQAYLQRDVRDRIELALSFARRHALLEALPYIHGDLNPENLLVNDATLDVQIIDFDGGTLIVDGTERPMTPGKTDDCMPPELKRKSGVDMSRFTAAAERWSVGSLVGYFLFSTHPGFFLRHISARLVDAYAKTDEPWPEIDIAGPLFFEKNRVPYEAMKSGLSSVPVATRELFVRFFKAGTRGVDRPTSDEWVVALEDLRSPPHFVRAALSESFVVEGESVTITWDARNAARVEILGVGIFGAVGSANVPVAATASYELVARNPNGEAVVKTDVVRVVPLPRITSIPVPAAPGLTLTTRLPALPTFESRRVPSPYVTSMMPDRADLPPSYSVDAPRRREDALSYPAAPPAVLRRVPIGAVVAAIHGRPASCRNRATRRRTK